MQPHIKTKNKVDESKEIVKPLRTFADVQNEAIEVLQTVYDPEIPVNVYELGLIYEVNVSVDLNIDMVGRWDDRHKDSTNFVYIIGADRMSKQLHVINEEANKKHVGLKLDYTYNNPEDPNKFYQRSDHYNFVKKKIPVIFYFNGVHEDYHKAGDEVSKIDFNLMEKRARLVFFTAWEIANRNERIKLD